MSRLVTVVVDGDTNVHLPGATSDYVTLCGLDGDDPGAAMYTIATKRGAKVDCEQCQAIWQLCKQFRSASFIDLS